MNGYMYEPYLFMYRMNDLKREKTASEQNIVYIYIYIYIYFDISPQNLADKIQ